MTTRGYSLLEVLVALVLISIALLGLAGLQIRAQQGEVEAYQRAQAMLLVNDMIDRIALNRDGNTERCYVTEDAQGDSYTLGTGNVNIPACVGFGSAATRVRADADMTAWNALLQGTGERLSDDDWVGGLRGARGCIAYQAEQAGPPLVPESITVTVAWQGEVETGASANDCAAGLYGNASLRRTTSDTIRFAELD
jgi:type IV pilus assembly protein PilV